MFDYTCDIPIGTMIKLKNKMGSEMIGTIESFNIYDEEGVICMVSAFKEPYCEEKYYNDIKIDDILTKDEIIEKLNQFNDNLSDNDPARIPQKEILQQANFNDKVLYRLNPLKYAAYYLTIQNNDSYFEYEYVKNHYLYSEIKKYIDIQSKECETALKDNDFESDAEAISVQVRFNTLKQIQYVMNNNEIKVSEIQRW